MFRRAWQAAECLGNGKAIAAADARIARDEGRPLAMDLLHPLAGALIGLLVGLTGVGGGSLMAPMLILIFGFSPAVAIGTDLWFAAITKTVGGLVHRSVGSPEWKVVGRLAIGSIPAATLTLLWLGSSHQGRLESSLLMTLLGAALLLTAMLMPLKSRYKETMSRLRHQMNPGLRQRQLVATIASGALVGCLVTLTSVGAGALVAALLMLLYPLRLDTKAIVSTDIVHAVPLALVAAIGHSWFGNVDWQLLGTLLIGSIPGIVAGSLLASRVNERLIRTALAIMLALTGLKLILS